MDEIIRTLRERENFVVGGHIGPDGDTIGSCFALANALHKIGKKVQVVLEPFARKYTIIPGREFLFSGDLDTLAPDVFVAIDCADVDRLGAARSVFDRADVTICIDHHETNPGFATYNYIEAEASSASEMTLRVIDGITEPTPEIAAAVYAGMVSDTGGFRHNATAKSTMETAARLMEMIPFTEIYNELIHIHRFQAGKALGLALMNSNRTEDKKIVFTFMTRELLKSIDANHSDLDGVVEYMMGTRDALVSFFVYEKGVTNSDTVKVSLRSKGPNVGRVAMRLGGGGHGLAAGATVADSVENTLKRALLLAQEEVKNFEGEQIIAEVKPAGHTGVINIRKEKGYTSHDVVAVVRKAVQAKTGHTGTLDPDATGVLPVCVGRTTKLAEYFAASDKTYIAEIVTGITTDTGDITGEVLTRSDMAVDYEKLKAVAESFRFKERGEYLQTPPMYSAVKIDGQKLYELARKGKTVERQPRPVKILDLQMQPPREDGKIFMEVTCSKGTYIRSLCMDIGDILGCGAVMGELERTRSGMFSIENSYTLEEVKHAAENETLCDLLLPVTQVLPFPIAHVTTEGLARALNGNALPVECVISETPIEAGAKCWLYTKTENSRLIGLFLRNKNNYRAEVMF
ncbi:MAG: tRNA pseudouridine(55) synthase TruB [Defluviitaleaceae bacterium]|nr:tRNA pseudouridine(55) synthase TruB [Defluviitaleaceae bacterium]MCL2262813.1 tRNA pseudouridine(55) synthase TruB [Defluviitaleaceae bacterium]MCL2263871.1 tRNA pseudouridine(55) synthase TruB [Defluviitaleaceae bacterium]